MKADAAAGSSPYYQLAGPPQDRGMADAEAPAEGTPFHAQVVAYASQLQAQKAAGDSNSDSGSTEGAPALRGVEGAPVQRRAATDYDDYFRHDRHGALSGSSEGRSARAGCCCGTAVGNNVQFWRLSPRAKLFPRICIWGPDWPCMFVTYALLIAPTVAFLMYVAPSLHTAVVALGVLLCVVAVAMFTMTNASDPGIVRKQTEAQLEVQRARLAEEARLDTVTVCQFCNVFREHGTQHCYDCNACVLELDHHCPWTGKCIGKYNLRFFYAFLWSMTALLGYVVVCTLVWVLTKQVSNAARRR